MREKLSLYQSREGALAKIEAELMRVKEENMRLKS